LRFLESKDFAEARKALRNCGLSADLGEQFGHAKLFVSPHLALGTVAALHDRDQLKRAMRASDVVVSQATAVL